MLKVSIAILEGIESIIHDGAFYGCTGLKTVIFPDGVQSIGYKTFSNCTNLESVVIYECIKSISVMAFYGCASLQSVVLPNQFCDTKNKERISIIVSANCIPYGEFIQNWKGDNGLVGKSYSDEAVFFLYQLQNIETFEPTWNKILNQSSEIGIEDIIKFSGNKKVCKPSWMQDDKSSVIKSNEDVFSDNQDPANNVVGLETKTGKFPEFGHMLSSWFTVRDCAKFAHVAKTKDMSSVSSSGLVTELSVSNSYDPEEVNIDEDNHVNRHVDGEIFSSYLFRE